MREILSSKLALSKTKMSILQRKTQREKEKEDYIKRGTGRHGDGENMESYK